MRLISITLILLAAALATVAAAVDAQSSTDHHDELQLSEGVQGLIRAEMAEIALAIQTIPLSLATGDWASIESTSAKIRDSYVLKKNLTEVQKQELKRKLPEPFKALDMDFHDRADKLGIAAANHDSELATFHFYRLLESCSSCHELYAGTRFPGLVAARPDGHQH